MKATLKRRIYMAYSVLGVTDGPTEEFEGLRFQVNYIELRFRARRRTWVFDHAKVKGSVIGPDGNLTRKQVWNHYDAADAAEWLTALAANHEPAMDTA